MTTQDMNQWPTAKGTKRADRIKHLTDAGEHLAAARAFIGPVALGMVCGLEGTHRLTGTPRAVLATMAVSETVFALLVVKEAERLLAVASSAAAFEKFEKARAEVASKRKDVFDADDRERDILRRRRERRNERNQRKH